MAAVARCRGREDLIMDRTLVLPLPWRGCRDANELLAILGEIAGWWQWCRAKPGARARRGRAGSVDECGVRTMTGALGAKRPVRRTG